MRGALVRRYTLRRVQDSRVDLHGDLIPPSDLPRWRGQAASPEWNGRLEQDCLSVGLAPQAEKQDRRVTLVLLVSPSFAFVADCRVEAEWWELGSFGAEEQGGEDLSATSRAEVHDCRVRCVALTSLLNRAGKAERGLGCAEWVRRRGAGREDLSASLHLEEGSRVPE